MSVYQTIRGLFERNGRNAYHGEAVSQAEHALQSAHLAELDGADDALVVSALLHDVGHFLEEAPKGLAQRGVDGRHETAGAAWLEIEFGPEVSEPARLHVLAKRYLCAVDPDYLKQLSPASITSLHLQGGPLKGDDLKHFEADPHRDAAVKLRRWDDFAKVEGLEVPGLEHYKARIERLSANAEPILL